MTQSNNPFSASIIPFRVPEQMRVFAETGVSQARANYTRLRDAAQNGNGTIEAMLAGASRNASDYVAKLFEFSAANANAGFDLVQHLAEAKSITEVIGVLTHHSRTQMETFAGQTRELSELTGRMVSDMVSLAPASKPPVA